MLLNKADHVMKYKKIKALIEKAGFYYVGEGRGFGLAEGKMLHITKKTIMVLQNNSKVFVSQQTKIMKRTSYQFFA